MCAFSYITAVFGWACCVVISCEIRQSNVKCITWGVTYFAYARWKIKQLLAVVSAAARLLKGGKVGEEDQAKVDGKKTELPTNHVTWRPPHTGLHSPSCACEKHFPLYLFLGQQKSPLTKYLSLALTESDCLFLKREDLSSSCLESTVRTVYMSHFQSDQMTLLR